VVKATKRGVLLSAGRVDDDVVVVVQGVEGVPVARVPGLRPRRHSVLP
jgi:hypothetical protein